MIASFDLVIRGASVVTVDDADTVLQRADLAIHNGVIQAIGPDLACRGEREIEGSGSAVIPGLVNSHTHQCLLRGTREDRRLDAWLEELCFPMEHALRAEHSVAAALMNQLEMIRGGTTTFVDMYRHLDEVAPVVDQSGLRAVLAPQIMDVGSGRGETWDEAESFVRNWASAGHPRIDAWVGPHAPYTVEAEGYLRARRLADEVGSRVMTHLSETKWEVDQIRAREGCSPVEWLNRLGLLDGLLAAHAVWLDDADRELLAAHGAAVVHNPSSNLKLASGTADIPAALAAGITVGLGTDSILSNNNLDMLEEMRTAAFVQKALQRDAAALPAHAALRMATMGSAAAIGKAHLIGSIEIGKRADLAIVDLTAPHLWPIVWHPTSNLVEQLVYSASASDVTHTVVDGVLLMDDRRVLTLDEDSARADVSRASKDLLAQLTPST